MYRLYRQQKFSKNRVPADPDYLMSLPAVPDDNDLDEAPYAYLHDEM